MTTKVKHTPGPWHIDSLGKVRCAAEGGKGFICDPGDGRYAGSIPRIDAICDANACLIAAAPELLAALTELVEFDRDPDIGSVGDFVVAIERAKAAIAKARGE